MTAGQFREVDPDLLADYVGGALAGTPAEATVDRLVTEDPDWEHAYADLVRATDAVRLDLADWGAEPEPMPADVADRLTAALRDSAAPESPRDSADLHGVADLLGVVDRPDAAGSQSDTGPFRPGKPAPDRVTGPGRRSASGVPDQTRPGGARNRGTAPGRRRWSRLAGPVAVAAAVAAFAGFGMSRLVAPQSSSDSAVTSQRGGSSSGDSAPESATGVGPPRALSEPSAERLLASGTNYTPANLAGLAGDLDRQAGDDVATRSAPTTGSEDSGGGTPNALARLTDRTALSGCLDAVAVEHDRGALTVEVVDYAAFEGTPALVIRYLDDEGGRWALVAGPACGLPGSGADTRYRAQVG
nr:hypothetical protein [Micromonospora sp. DSM 115978]